MNHIAWNDLQLDSKEIFRRVGMPADANRSASFGPLVDNMRKRALELIQPQAVYEYVPMTVLSPEEIIFAGHMIHAAAEYFEGAEEVFVSIMTVGELLEAESARLFRAGDLLEGLILDGCGTVAVDEMVADLRRRVVEEVQKQGLQPGYNLSPGGRQISLEVQRDVFAILPGESIGVALLESHLMQPVKSHSLLIPVGRHLTKSKLSCTITCEACSGRETCPHNRVRFAQASEVV